MERLEKWITDIISYFVSGICLWRPHTCEEWANFIALLIGLITLFFITLPKAWPNIKKLFGRVLP